MARPVDTLGLGPTYSIIEKDDLFEVIVTPGKLMGPNPKKKSITLTRNQFTRFNKWRNGHGLIQDIFPDLTSEQREILMTGL